MQQINYDAGSGGRLLDFGPPLPYETLSEAYTVERLTLWQRETRDEFEVVPIRAPYMPQARLEGTLYKLSPAQFMELDQKREVGVQYDRKLMPVLVPQLDEEGNFTRISAYIYVAIRRAWASHIQENLEEPHNLFGGVGARPKVYSLVKTYPDSNRVLHNRQCFMPPEYPPLVVGDPPPSVIKNVRKRNKTLSRRFYFENIKKRMNGFINDE